MAIIQMAYDKPTAIRIRDFLIKQGMTLEGAYGMLANIYSESGFRSNNAQNSYMTKMGMTDESYTAQVDNGQYTLFCTDRVGYGLCQWTSSGRKTGLLNYAKEQNKSIGDETMQLNYLIKELSSAYKTVFNKLKTSHDIAECAKYIMTKFERSADQSETAQNKRANYGLQLFEDLENVKEEIKMGYTNSSLVNYILLSPNCSKPRNNKIKKIVIHHMAGNLTVEVCGKVFQPTSRQASSNYGVGTDGRVGMYVEEQNRAWTSGNATVDNQAVTIEVANDVIGGDWHVSDKALAKTIELCADICRRNNIEKLNFTGDKNGNLVAHRYYQSTTCPGQYLYSKFSYIADEVNKLLGVIVPPIQNTNTVPSRSYLMKGDKGTDVKVLQENLNYLGYSCGKADGDFGTKTHNALIDFQEDYQKSHNLTVDGKYGANSKRVLEDVVAKKKNSVTSTAKTYTVVDGDTLSKIGDKTGVNWKTIAQLNGIKSPYIVKIGQVLKLSEGSTTQSKPTTTSSNSVNYTYKGVNYSLVFNPTYYSNKYPDLKKAFGTNATKLFSHFCEYGLKEGRQAIDSFNVEVYKNNYTDLRNAFGNDLPKYYEHYIQYGYKEGRRAK